MISHRRSRASLRRTFSSWRRMVILPWKLLLAIVLLGFLVEPSYSADSFLQTECLHKAPAGIALTDHVVKAKGGNVQSMFCAGAIKLYVSREYHNAIPWLEQAANAGHMRAPLVLGILYEQGTGVKEDAATAAKWYEKGIENGNAAAARRLANLYHVGTGVPHDEAKSNELLKKAVEMGDKAAPKFIEKREQDTKDRRPGMAIKAEAYRLYKQKQFAQAAKLYRQCADMGNDDCQLAMGQLYEFGDGVPKDERQAAAWYRKCAEQDNPIGQKRLGWLYELGTGVPENWAEAARLYAKSADRYNESAFMMGRLYEFGMAVPQNRAISIEWFKKAHKLGHPKGAYWAKWLSDYSNCIGFRNQQEQNELGGLRCPADPVGAVFHTSGERTTYIRRTAKEFDRIEAEQAMAQAARSSQTTDTGCTMAGGRWTADRQATFGGYCN
ncbi:MAG: sel1 repeat family protein [Nitrospira sp.]|nr:sel1 repeat family protein [Nitrospira sp.]